MAVLRCAGPRSGTCGRGGADVRGRSWLCSVARGRGRARVGAGALTSGVAHGAGAVDPPLSGVVEVWVGVVTVCVCVGVVSVCVCVGVVSVCVSVGCVSVTVGTVSVTVGVVSVFCL